MEIILKYFPDLSDEQLRQFELLSVLYKDWNLKINVVSRKDIDELYLSPDEKISPSRFPMNAIRVLNTAHQCLCETRH